MSTSVRPLLRQFFLRVHPDVFSSSPHRRAVNEVSFQRLQALIQWAEQPRGNSPLPAGSKLEFFVRSSSDDTPLRISVPVDEYAVLSRPSVEPALAADVVDFTVHRLLHAAGLSQPTPPPVPDLTKAIQQRQSEEAAAKRSQPPPQAAPGALDFLNQFTTTAPLPQAPTQAAAAAATAAAAALRPAASGLGPTDAAAHDGDEDEDGDTAARAARRAVPRRGGRLGEAFALALGEDWGAVSPPAAAPGGVTPSASADAADSAGGPLGGVATVEEVASCFRFDETMSARELAGAYEASVAVAAAPGQGAMRVWREIGITVRPRGWHGVRAAHAPWFPDRDAAAGAHVADTRAALVVVDEDTVVALGQRGVPPDAAGYAVCPVSRCVIVPSDFTVDGLTAFAMDNAAAVAAVAAAAAAEAAAVEAAVAAACAHLGATCVYGDQSGDAQLVSRLLSLPRGALEGVGVVLSHGTMSVHPELGMVRIDVSDHASQLAAARAAGGSGSGSGNGVRRKSAKRRKAAGSGAAVAPVAAETDDGGLHGVADSAATADAADAAEGAAPADAAAAAADARSPAGDDAWIHSAAPPPPPPPASLAGLRSTAGRAGGAADDVSSAASAPTAASPAALAFGPAPYERFVASIQHHMPTLRASHALSAVLRERIGAEVFAIAAELGLTVDPSGLGDPAVVAAAERAALSGDRRDGLSAFLRDSTATVALPLPEQLEFIRRVRRLTGDLTAMGATDGWTVAASPSRHAECDHEARILSLPPRFSPRVVRRFLSEQFGVALPDDAVLDSGARGAAAAGGARGAAGGGVHGGDDGMNAEDDCDGDGAVDVGTPTAAAAAAAARGGAAGAAGAAARGGGDGGDGGGGGGGWEDYLADADSDGPTSAYTDTATTAAADRAADGDTLSDAVDAPEAARVAQRPQRRPRKGTRGGAPRGARAAAAAADGAGVAAEAVGAPMEDGVMQRARAMAAAAGFDADVIFGGAAGVPTGGAGAAGADTDANLPPLRPAVPLVGSDPSVAALVRGLRADLRSAAPGAVSAQRFLFGQSADLPPALAAQWGLDSVVRRKSRGSRRVDEDDTRGLGESLGPATDPWMRARHAPADDMFVQAKAALRAAQLDYSSKRVVSLLQAAHHVEFSVAAHRVKRRRVRRRRTRELLTQLFAYAVRVADAAAAGRVTRESVMATYISPAARAYAAAAADGDASSAGAHIARQVRLAPLSHATRTRPGRLRFVETVGSLLVRLAYRVLADTVLLQLDREPLTVTAAATAAAGDGDGSAHAGGSHVADIAASASAATLRAAARRAPDDHNIGTNSHAAATDADAGTSSSSSPAAAAANESARAAGALSHIAPAEMAALRGDAALLQAAAAVGVDAVGAGDILSSLWRVSPRGHIRRVPRSASGGRQRQHAASMRKSKQGFSARFVGDSVPADVRKAFHGLPRGVQLSLVAAAKGGADGEHAASGGVGGGAVAAGDTDLYAMLTGSSQVPPQAQPQPQAMGGGDVFDDAAATSQPRSESQPKAQPQPQTPFTTTGWVVPSTTAPSAAAADADDPAVAARRRAVVEALTAAAADIRGARAAPGSSRSTAHGAASPTRGAARRRSGAPGGGDGTLSKAAAAAARLADTTPQERAGIAAAVLKANPLRVIITDGLYRGTAASVVGAVSAHYVKVRIASGVYRGRMVYVAPHHVDWSGGAIDPVARRGALATVAGVLRRLQDEAGVVVPVTLADAGYVPTTLSSVDPKATGAAGGGGAAGSDGAIDTRGLTHEQASALRGHYRDAAARRIIEWQLSYVQQWTDADEVESGRRMDVNVDRTMLAEIADLRRWWYNVAGSVNDIEEERHGRDVERLESGRLSLKARVWPDSLAQQKGPPTIVGLANTRAGPWSAAGAGPSGLQLPTYTQGGVGHKTRPAPAAPQVYAALELQAPSWNDTSHPNSDPRAAAQLDRRAFETRRAIRRSGEDRAVQLRERYDAVTSTMGRRVSTFRHPGGRKERLTVAT